MSDAYLIVEDHPLTAEGIRQQLLGRGALTVLAVGTLAEAGAALAQRAFDTLLIDLSLPDGDGVDFYCEVAARQRGLRAVLLSGMLTDADIQRALAAGFAAILTKDSTPELLLDALARVEAGDSYYSPDVAPVVDSLQGGDLFTPRMIEVLSLLQDGQSNKQIAAALKISEATVSFHIAQIKTRLGARTNRQIISQARKLGISIDSKP